MPFITLLNECVPDLRLLRRRRTIVVFCVMTFWHRVSDCRGVWGRLRLKCDGTRAETRFLLSANRTGRFKSAGASVRKTTGSRVVRISGSNAGYTKFRGGVEGTGYTLHSPVSPSLPVPCVTVCHHVSIGLYTLTSLSGMCAWRCNSKTTAFNGKQIPDNIFLYVSLTLHLCIVL